MILLVAAMTTVMAAGTPTALWAWMLVKQQSHYASALEDQRNIVQRREEYLDTLPTLEHEEPRMPMETTKAVEVESEPHGDSAKPAIVVKAGMVVATTTKTNVAVTVNAPMGDTTSDVDGNTAAIAATEARPPSFADCTGEPITGGDALAPTGQSDARPDQPIVPSVGLGERSPLAVTKLTVPQGIDSRPRPLKALVYCGLGDNVVDVRCKPRRTAGTFIMDIAADVSNRLGGPPKTEAGIISARVLCNRLMTDAGHRPSHIMRDVPIVVALVCHPTRSEQWVQDLAELGALIPERRRAHWIIRWWNRVPPGGQLE